jgi:hypothetical protein
MANPNPNLTAENLRKVAGPSQAEREEALMDRLQTISQLLGKVDDALEDCGSSRPPPTASSRPPTGRPLSQQSQQQQPPPTAERRGSKANHERPPITTQQGVQQEHLLQLDDAKGLVIGKPARSNDVALVNYTGLQSNTAQIQRLRKIDARATRSEMGSILGSDAAPSDD